MPWLHAVPSICLFLKTLTAESGTWCRAKSKVRESLLFPPSFPLRSELCSKNIDPDAKLVVPGPFCHVKIQEPGTTICEAKSETLLDAESADALIMDFFSLQKYEH
jgi:hypothetical protein